MKLSRGFFGWFCRFGILAFMTMLGGCAQVTQSVVDIKEKAFGPDDLQFVELQPSNWHKSHLTGEATGVSSSLRPDLLCAVPQEEFDYAEILKKRFGTEAVIRLQTLMASNFTRADLSPEQKEMLKVLAQDTLWIPAELEGLVGKLLVQLQKEDLKTVSMEGARGRYWTVSEDLYTQLLNVAPRTPFDTELAILRRGRPNAVAGGTIFIDQETVRKAVESNSSTQRAKLAFVYAHELAHVFKRHKAKQIQQQLIETDEGLSMLRLLTNGLDRSGEMDPMARIRGIFNKMGSAKRIVELLRTQHAVFTQLQEHEADSCAAHLMLASGLGNPITGFRTYVSDKPKGSSEADSPQTPYELHPPRSTRQKIIAKATQDAKIAMRQWKQNSN